MLKEFSRTIEQRQEKEKKNNIYIYKKRKMRAQQHKAPL